VLRLDGTIPDVDGIAVDEPGAVANNIDAAVGEGAGQAFRDALDQRLLAVDQLGPVEARLRHGDAMRLRLPDFVQRVACGDQHLLRRAAAIGAGPAEVAILDEGDLEPRLSRRHGDAEAGIAAAEDQHVIAVAGHDRA